MRPAEKTTVRGPLSHRGQTGPITGTDSLFDEVLELGVGDLLLLLLEVRLRTTEIGVESLLMVGGVAGRGQLRDAAVDAVLGRLEVRTCLVRLEPCKCQLYATRLYLNKAALRFVR